MNFKGILLTGLFIGVFLPQLKAEFLNPADSSRLSFGIEVPVTYSYLGLAGCAGVTLTKSVHTFAAGMRTSFTYFTRYSDMPYGGYTGYRLALSHRKKFVPFAEVFYANQFFKISSPSGAAKGLYQAHEIYLAYGASWHLTNRLHLAHSIGFGGYQERHPNFYGSSAVEQKHVGYFTKVAIGYAF
ncbi:MAG: hypothetical protein K1X81_11370 [Bacteroidia bacterium]|nr:hypothetical protein [Bacteroidia bacterium]